MSNLRKATLKNLKSLRNYLKGKTMEDEIVGYNNPIDFKLDTYEETAEELAAKEKETKQIDFKEKTTRETSSIISDFKEFKKKSKNSKFDSPSFGNIPKSKEDKKNKKMPKNNMEQKLDTSPVKHNFYF